MADWRVGQAVLWSCLTAATIGYAAVGFPHPRPTFVFLGIALAVALLFWHVHSRNRDLTRFEIGLILCAAYVSTFLLRWTMWSNTVVAGWDMIMHVHILAEHIVRTGAIASSAGMYSYAPFIHIFTSVNQLITGLPLVDVRLVNVMTSSFLPFGFGLLGYRLYNKETGLYAVILGISFPLFTRVGAMMDAELLVLFWFVGLTYLFVRMSSDYGPRYRVVIVILLFTSIFIHFLYALIMVGVSAGVALLLKFDEYAITKKFGTQRTQYLPIAAVAGSIVLVSYRVLGTGVGRGATSSFLFDGAGIEVPTTIKGFFLPTGGAVSRATTTGGGSTDMLSTILNYYPLFFFVAMGAVGVIVFVNRLYQDGFSRIGHRTFLYLSIIVSSTTVVSLVIFSTGDSMRIAFRLYYFLGLLGLIFCAIGTKYLVGVPLRSNNSRAIFDVIIIALILGLSITGPMSTIGNAIDPRFGGDSYAFTMTNRYEFNQIDRYTPGTEMIELSENVTVEMTPGGAVFAPRGESDSTLITPRSDDCMERVWTGQSFSLCYRE